MRLKMWCAMAMLLAACEIESARTVIESAYPDGTMSEIGEERCGSVTIGSDDCPPQPIRINGVPRCQDLPQECQTPVPLPPDGPEGGLHCIPGNAPDGTPWVDHLEVPCSCTVISGPDSWCVRLSN